MDWRLPNAGKKVAITHAQRVWLHDTFRMHACRDCCQSEHTTSSGMCHVIFGWAIAICKRYFLHLTRRAISIGYPSSAIHTIAFDDTRAMMMREICSPQEMQMFAVQHLCFFRSSHISSIKRHAGGTEKRRIIHYFMIFFFPLFNPIMPNGIRVKWTVTTLVISLEWTTQLANTHT